MKTIPLNEMQNIQGGTKLASMCFQLGIITVVAVFMSPAAVQAAFPAIKYCWNH
jgi:hypothetical protein